LILDKNFDFWQKFGFWPKIWIFKKKYYFGYFNKKYYFGKNSDYWQKLGFLTKKLNLAKISILEKIFDFWQKFGFLTKNTFFGKNSDFWQKLGFLQKNRILAKIPIFDKKKFVFKPKIFIFARKFSDIFWQKKYLVTRHVSGTNRKNTCSKYLRSSDSFGENL